MGDSTEVQALAKISSEVDESQIKIALSNQCIKAQAFLVDKLRKETERQKEKCIFISNSNFKLETDIKQVELEIHSLRTSYETIRSANVELRKELLLAKENKSEIEEHVRLGEKKYEDLWLESKSRYESIPYVQTLLATRKTAQTLGDDITALQNEAHNLVNDIDKKKTELKQLDQNRIIELANYLTHEMPDMLNKVKEKSSKIKTLKKEIEEISKERKAKDTAKKHTLGLTEKKQDLPISTDLSISNTGDNNWPPLYSKDTLPMPKLKLVGTDFDALSAKLDQIKIKKGEMLQLTPVKRTDSLIGEESPTLKKQKCQERMPYFYFNKPATVEESINDFQSKSNFSKRKLINILEDIKLDKNKTYNFLAKVNPENLKDIKVIGTDATNEVKESNTIESEQIEELDLTVGSGNIGPPTQFMDYTQEEINMSSHQTADVIIHLPMKGVGNNKNTLKNSQENAKKRVSFDLPSNVQITQVDEEGNLEVEEDDAVQNAEAETDTNKTTNSELDVSGVSDESFMKIRDMILKKHNLDLSPQFVYAKNQTIQLQRNEENVTSKFFPQSKATVTDVPTPVQEENNNEKGGEFETQEKEDIVEDENKADTNPKIQEAEKVEKPVTGFLFKHGTQGMPDSLNMSISTTGFDDGEADFPHCIDSSLLLSPKADLPMPMSGENVVTSQEVPNFLSGLRKSGFSFFGISSTAETNADNSQQNPSNNFNFNFGGDEKKARGGLFSMFR